jgi:hypothetical protein
MWAEQLVKHRLLVWSGQNCTDTVGSARKIGRVAVFVAEKEKISGDKGQIPS